MKIKELDLIKQRDELKNKNKLNTTPWRIKSEELYKRLEKSVETKLITSYELASVKSSINTIIIKSLHIKNVTSMTQEELNMIEPFLDVVVDMVVNGKFINKDCIQQ
jgi:hypothetical protein